MGQKRGRRGAAGPSGRRFRAAQFWEVARFEWIYQFRRRMVWILGAAPPVLAFYLMKNLMEGARADGTLLNAPIEIVGATLLGSLFGLIVTAALAGDAATRDIHTGMSPLMYTAPLGRWTFVGGRFVGAFVLNAALLAGVPVGILLAVLTEGGGSELMGPFRLSAYIQPYLFFALPNVLASVAVLFAAAMLSRRALAAYAAGAVLFFVTMLNLEAGPVLFGWDLATYLDPFGAVAIRFLVRSWTLAERNVLLVPIEGIVVANRLLWLGITAAALTVAGYRFRSAHHVPGRLGGRLLFGRARAEKTTAAPQAVREEAASQAEQVILPRVFRRFDAGARVRQAFATARRSLFDIVSIRMGLVALGAVVLCFSTGPELLEHLGVPIVPTTARILALFAAMDLHVLVVAFIVFFAGELVWMDRDAGLHALTDAAPVHDAALLIGKFISLAVMIVGLQALLMITGILLQITLGHADFNLGVYAAVLFGFQLADYLLIAVLALAVHVIVNQKYVGHLVVLLAYTFTRFADVVGVEHNLLVYGADTGWTFSDYTGFGASVYPILLFKLYWLGWAVLLGVAARVFWIRGAELSLRPRLEWARRRFSRPAAGVLGLGLALILTTGGFIFYNTNVLNGYETSAEREEKRAEYERRYGRYDGVSQPELAATKLHVEIYPHERSFTVRGSYRLVNRAGRDIDSIHVATTGDAVKGGVGFSRPAKVVLLDQQLGHRIYLLSEPLEAGEEMVMEFDVRYEPRGFTNEGVPTYVTENGTYLEGARWLPSVGYDSSRELTEVGARRARGLPGRPAAPPLQEAAALRDVSGREMIEFEATVGTAVDQIALAPGALRRTWSEGGRRYFHYATDAPIRNGHAFMSARYAVHASRSEDVKLEIFHHPEHTLNVERMLRSLRISLNQFAARFGLYPYRQLRLVEVPGSDSGLRAHPINVRYFEGFSFLDAAADHRDLDLPFAVVSHEVAHQWWGNQLVPANVEGAPLLSESLAWYSTFGVVEEAYGSEHLHRLLALMREAYQDPRPRADVPLLRAADWFTAYRKGPFAMYAVREYVGEERVDVALRRLLQRHGAGKPPLPTSLDLYDKLQSVTPDSLKYLLVDLFERNTFWELKLEDARAEPIGTGRWRVTIDVSARKMEVDTSGAQTEHYMNDFVEVGIFGEDETRGSSRAIYSRMHSVRSGMHSITVTVGEKPVRAVIDPRKLLIDTKAEDNTMMVEASADGMNRRG